VSYYLSLVLNTVGITDPDTQTLINGLLQLFNFGAAIMAAFLVDRLGRRTLWNWSGCGMLVSFIVWTACSAEFDRTGKNELGIAVIVFIFVFYFHYDIAYTPLVFAYPAEINSYQTRSKAISAELGVVYCSLIMLSFVNPIALENIGWRYYVLFCVILAISVVVNWFLLPETKGRSLEELHELFDKDLPAHANANTVLENVMAKDEDTVQRAECV
jgi:MFS family permease